MQIEWTKRLQQGPAVHDELHAQQVATDTTSEATFVGAGDSNQLGPNARYAQGLLAVPHAAPVHASTAATCCRSGATGATCSGRSLGGWQVSGVIKLASGTPFTVTQTGRRPELRRVRRGPAGPARSVDARPLGRRSRHIDRRCCPRQRVPARTTIGDTLDQVVPRNSFFGDGIDNVDLGLYKNFTLRGGQVVQRPHRGLQPLQHGPVRVSGDGCDRNHVRPDHRHPLHLPPADHPAGVQVPVLGGRDFFPQNRGSRCQTSSGDVWHPGGPILWKKVPSPSPAAARSSISRAWRTGRFARWRRARNCARCSTAPLTGAGEPADAGHQPSGRRRAPRHDRHPGPALLRVRRRRQPAGRDRGRLARVGVGSELRHLRALADRLRRRRRRGVVAARSRGPAARRGASDS